jgi:serine protease Do
VPYALLGDSSHLTEGDFVMAMGAPWGMSRSVSIGIISSTRRYLPDNSEYSLWIQTDASISPGNSGGPLVNTEGEVIGINTRGVLFGGGVGFSVPAETVAELLPNFREHGRMPWNWTGIRLQPLRDFNRDIYFEADEGVIVAGTDPESPARHAGLKVRDRILSIGGTPVTAMTEESLPEIRRRLGSLPLGEATVFGVERGGRVLEFEITPREKGKVEGEEFDCPRWDLTIKTINQFENPSLYFHREKGVFVFGTRQPGNAARAGLVSQDIILEIDGRPVTTLDDVLTIHEEAMANIDSRRRMVFAILRNGLRRQVVLDYSRDYEKK